MASSREHPSIAAPSALASEHAGRSLGHDTPKPFRHRLALSGASPRRLSFERRIRLWMIGLATPALALAGALTFEHTRSLAVTLGAVLAVAVLWTIASSFLFEQLTRPLQTLSNVVAALREEDFSFRARGARRGDSLGDLALEVNALASTLQHQRSAALDALSLVELVLTSMQSPVLAFDSALRLTLLNPAAEQAFNLLRRHALGRTAQELNLSALLGLVDQDLYSPRNILNPSSGAPTADTRWSVRRSTFRLHGVPHSLFALADVAAALREEERLAWQRLIRVLGHEINNSLAPIKSIAGSLRTRLHLREAEAQSTQAPTQDPGDERSATKYLSAPQQDFDRGLAVIEDRADSLNRFLQAYQRLSRLPAPALSRTPLGPLIATITQLEVRLPIQVIEGPDVSLLADPDQIQQLLINLLRNAVDAALISASATSQPPQVKIVWWTSERYAILRILDNGLGLANTANLFVPFFTTKPGGTGVGLVLAQQIATAHRGTVTLRNRESSPGCVAEVRLPLVPHAGHEP